MTSDLRGSTSPYAPSLLGGVLSPLLNVLARKKSLDSIELPCEDFVACDMMYCCVTWSDILRLEAIDEEAEVCEPA